MVDNCLLLQVSLYSQNEIQETCSISCEIAKLTYRLLPNFIVLKD